MKFACAAIAGLTLLLAGNSAEARTHHYRHYASRHHVAWPVARSPEWPHSTFFGPRWSGDAQPWWQSDGGTTMQPARHVRLGNNSRPRAWCGWFMRQVKGVADSAYNLAWNWSHWGHPSGPVVGAVAVWHHHVGEIASGNCPAGRIMLHSGNDGNQVRTRCVPLRGAIFREA